MIAVAIFNTFLCLLARCSLAFANCSPGVFCNLSFKSNIEYNATIKVNGREMNTTDSVKKSFLSTEFPKASFHVTEHIRFPAGSTSFTMK